MKKWCALTSVLLFVIGQVWSQTTISGKVVSVESGDSCQLCSQIGYGKERGKPGRCAIGKQLHQYRSGCSHRNGNTPADERQPGAGIGYYGSGYPGSQPLDHGRSID